MPVIAKLNYLRIAPRKVRLAADLIRGKTVQEAREVLNFAVKRPAEPLLKLLKQATDNAKNNFHLDDNNLYVSKITVDEGPKLKRWRPRARGQAYEIQKKTSHITLVLEEIAKGSGKIKKIKTKDDKEKKEKIEKIKNIKKPRPRAEIEAVAPKTEKGIKKIFRRKAF